jgi:hypothetical protein
LSGVYRTAYKIYQPTTGGLSHTQFLGPGGVVTGTHALAFGGGCLKEHNARSLV